jgi:NAD(P)-dependent dehydrogenase (short-subunit alcohol dehydrogenase family)
MSAWRDQVALVTGGARGIGRATARLLAQRGAAVCVNYAAHAEAADRLAGEIAAGSGRAISVMADVADPSAVEAMVARTERELGPVTILVNNAGVSWQGTLDTYDREQVTRMRQVNVEGLIHATRAVSGGMRAPQYGRIVNISSIAAIGTALPGNAFYAATKAEVAILTKRFALELGRGKLCCKGNDGSDWRTGGYRQRCGLLDLARVRLDHSTDGDCGRRTNGLHRTRLDMIGNSTVSP